METKVKAVMDTNILIDYLNGANSAKKELQLYEECLISLVTWMEVLVGAKNGREEMEIKGFLRAFTVIPITELIAERAIKIRRECKIRLPDALIKASAEEIGCDLVTRNTKDFSRNAPGIRIPY